MFLQLFIYGSFNPILSLYLQKQLGMDGTTSGLVIGFGMVFGMISPLIGTMLADRFVTSRRLLQVCHLIASFLMILFSFQLPLFLSVITYFLFSFMHGPSYSLVNSLTFTHLDHPSKQYGEIRSWGTVGWILAGYCLTLLVLVSTKLLGLELQEKDILPWAYRFAAVAGVLLSLLAHSLPDKGEDEGKETKEGAGEAGTGGSISADTGGSSPTDTRGKKGLLPAATLRALKNPAMALMLVYYFVSGIMDRFYTFGAAPYLSSLGLSDELVMPALTLGQILELPALLLIGRILSKFKAGKVLILGLLLQISRFLIFSFSSSVVPLLLALSFNGLIFAFFYTPATIFIDKLAGAEGRSGVHQISGILFMGVGGLFGNALAGLVFDLSGGSASFWLVPLVISVLLSVLFILFPPGGKFLGKSSSALLE